MCTDLKEKLSEEENKYLKNLFKLASYNTHLITNAELFKGIINELGIYDNCLFEHKLFIVLKGNGNGINQEDFLTKMAIIHYGDEAQKAHLLFTLADLDSNGYIDFDEFKLVIDT